MPSSPHRPNHPSKPALPLPHHHRVSSQPSQPPLSPHCSPKSSRQNPPQPSNPASNSRPRVPQESSRGRSLSYQDLSRCFHLPINSAARELGVCVTALKKQCRKHGVPRWPHRKLKSLDKLKEKLEKEEATAADKEYYKHEIHSIVQKKDHIFRANPGAHDSSASDDRVELQKPSAPAVPDSPIYRAGIPDSARPHGARASYPGKHMVVSNVATLQHPGMPSSHPTHTLIPPQALGAMPIAAPHVSFCGIIGCDCYLNAGVSSQNYHLPLPNRTLLNSPNTSLVTANNPSNLSATLPTNPPQYFNPVHTQFSYPIAYAPPLQSMMQVNPMERHPHPHHAAFGASQQMPNMPQSTQAITAAAPNSSPNLLQAGHLPPSSAGPGPLVNGTAPPYEVFANGQADAVGQPSGFLYGAFAPKGTIPVDGMIQAAQSNAGTAQMIPHFWSDMSHASNANNLVTMYNQRTPYHQYHTAEPIGKGQVAGVNAADGTASSVTNNSDATESRTQSTKRGASAAPSKTMPAYSRDTPKRSDAARLRGERGGSLPTMVANDNGSRATAKPATVGKIASTNNADSETRGNVEAQPKRPSWGHVCDGEVEEDKGRPEERLKTGNSRGKESELASICTARGRISKEAGQSFAPATVQNSRRLGEQDVQEGQDSGEAVAREEIRNLNEEGTEYNVARKGELLEDVSRTTSRRHDMSKGNSRGNNRTGNGLDKSPSKRPRNGGVVEGENIGNERWRRHYSGVDIGEAPATLQRERETAVGEREITPPSREETPDDQGIKNGIENGDGDADGSGSGSGSRSGSGNLTVPTSDGLGGTSKSGSEELNKKEVEELSKRSHRDEGEYEGEGEDEDEDGSDPPSPSMRGAMKRRKLNGNGMKAWRLRLEDGNGSGEGDGMSDCPSIPVKARRYEHVVHHCVSVGCAQWCTDKNFRVSLCVGSKGLLRSVGVGSQGRVAFEGTEAGGESRHSLRNRYNTALKGQRTEWTFSDGRKRYLVVLGPFWKRIGAEISGTSGLIVEVSENVNLD